MQQTAKVLSVIQSILLFSLGFFCAAFLALLIAPAVWRRAVVLTRKRIEASVPLSLNEIQAEKDRMRAEFAMSTRRLEMTITSLKEKATSNIVELTQARDELARIKGAREEVEQETSEKENRETELQNEVKHRDTELERVTALLEVADRQIEERDLELDKLKRELDEISMMSSNHEIELVSRESEAVQLAGNLDDVKAEREAAQKRIRELEGNVKSAAGELRRESKRAEDNEKKLERTKILLAESSEKLKSRNQEYAALRSELKTAGADLKKAVRELAASEKLRAKAEDLVAEQASRLNLFKLDSGLDPEKAIEKLQRKLERSSERTKSISAENRKLKAEIEKIGNSGHAGPEVADGESAVLRDQLHQLAAEMATLTATLEGPQSPIRSILAVDTQNTGSGPGESGELPSLADRMRSLQKVAASQ